MVFQGLRDNPGLTFYAPFATAVLLLALAPTTTCCGRLDLGRRLPASAAASVGDRGAQVEPGHYRSRVILAATFAVVAVIPLETFRQVAFTMTVGLLIDTLIVRPVLTPAVLTLLGPAASWPGPRIRSVPLGSRTPAGEVA